LIGFRIRTGDDEFTEVAYDRNFVAVYVDRTKSGDVLFHSAFAGRHHAPARLIDGEVSLHIIVDRSTNEGSVDDCEAGISDKIFPCGREAVIEVLAGDKVQRSMEQDYTPASQFGVLGKESDCHQPSTLIAMRFLFNKVETGCSRRDTQHANFSGSHRPCVEL
jgi:hypothetical protein